MTDTSGPSHSSAVLAGGVLALVVLTGACTRSGSPSRCQIVSDADARFVLTSSVGSVTISQQESEGLRRLSSVGEGQAKQGGLVFGVDDVGATMIVLGPPEMASVAIRGMSDSDTTKCLMPALSVAAMEVERGATVTVDGLGADGDVLFSRTERVPDGGSAVIAPVGPPPTT